MSKNTKIEWATHTFNPWEGCQKVGPGCDHCYAENRNARFGGGTAANWGPGAPRRRTSAANWHKPLAWNAAHEAFFAEHGYRQRLFCSSLADVFDNAVDPQWRADLFALIVATPHLDWLLLTKRIGNVKPMLKALRHGSDEDLTLLDMMPLPNVWLGATIVNQEEADRDIPKLLAIPATKRFLSMEPLLAPVSLGGFDGKIYRPWLDHHAWKTEIDWVIVGGESGPGARPMHPQWVRDLRDQCAAAGVPYIFKQWGEWAPRAGALTGGGANFSEIDPSCTRWPDVIRLGEHGLNTRISENCTDAMGEEVYMQRVGKKAAGRLLDGIEHNGFPK